jgi:hypothetical protein
VQDRHFIECIASGARPLTDGQNGLAVVEALEAAELSRRLGRPVLLAELGAAGHFTQSFSLGNGHSRGPATQVAAMSGSLAAAAPLRTFPSQEPR